MNARKPVTSLLYGACDRCGCSDFDACVDPMTGEPCAWVRQFLCSLCALFLAGEFFCRRPDVFVFRRDGRFVVAAVQPETEGALS